MALLNISWQSKNTLGRVDVMLFYSYLLLRGFDPTAIGDCVGRWQKLSITMNVKDLRRGSKTSGNHSQLCDHALDHYHVLGHDLDLYCVLVTLLLGKKENWKIIIWRPKKKIEKVDKWTHSSPIAYLYYSLFSPKMPVVRAKHLAPAENCPLACPHCGRDS